MPLPDVSRLGDVPEARWRALGARLRALDAAARHSEIAAIGGGFFDPACKPLQRWRARRDDAPADRLLRLFSLGDPITEDEARGALGDVSLGEIVDAGLIARERDRYVSPFVLRAHEGIFFFADHLHHGGDAVMGAGPYTAPLIRAARPAHRIGRALELGCGAGLVALGLAPHADTVIATEINPRALVLARANLALNGVTNVELRRGDLFAPVAGERFDRIAFQPPFFPAPEGGDESTFSHGGSRGDELALRALVAIPDHLTPDGRGVLAMSWPVFDDEPLARRLRGVLPKRTNLLLVESESADVDTFCMADTAFSHPDFGPAYQSAVLAQREHVERVGIRGFRGSLVIVSRATATDAEGWTGSFEAEDCQQADGPLLEALFSSHALLHRSRDMLFAAKLRVREGTSFVPSTEGLVHAVFTSAQPAAEVRIDASAHQIVTIVDAAPNVEAAAKRFAKQTSLSRSTAQARFLSIVDQMLRVGVLEIVRG